ncbi:MAG: ComEA family DNA-binding protein [Pseudomonadales bacterium]
MKNVIAVIVASLLMSLGGLAMAQEGHNGSMPAGTAEEMPEEVTMVNVNEADAETIAAVLRGVGMTRAKAIVDYRDQYGDFYSAEELIAVKGIGQATVNRNLDRILVEPEPEAEE